MSPAESDDLAQAINARNARIQAGVDALLMSAARWAVSIIGGATLGLYAINVVWGGA
jgi:hypothetical protein